MAPSSPVEITHLGGKTSVTGSCHLLRGNGLNILVDCGAVQGGDAAVPMEEWPVQPRNLDYVFVTHAHVDHIGRIPELIRRGFQGEIVATEPTKALLMPMLRDAMAFSHLPRPEIDKLSQSIDDLSRGFETGTPFDLKNNVRFTLGCAGHILGSCFIRFESRDPTHFASPRRARRTRREPVRDEQQERVMLITVCCPSAMRWEYDWKTGKRQAMRPVRR